MQQLRQSLLHFCTVLLRRSLTDIGTGVWSQETVALPIWTLNTVFMFFNVRIGHCARTAQIWQSTLHIYGVSPKDRVQTHSSPNKTQSNMLRTTVFLGGIWHL